MEPMRQAARWLAAITMAGALAGCGGGDSEPQPEAAAAEQPAAQQPAPPPAAPAAAPVLAGDVRNGSYPVYASHGSEYALSLDFDAKTWRMAGAGFEQAGRIGENDGEFHFLPADSSPAQTTSTARFTLANDTVMGNFALPYSTTVATPVLQPIIAPRDFVRSMAEAEGRYAWFVVPRDGGNLREFPEVSQAELRDGRLSVDRVPLLFDACFGDRGTGAVTLAAELFTWHTCAGDVTFRIARVGADKVMLRAGPLPIRPAMVLGLHESAVFVPGAASVAIERGATARGTLSVSDTELVVSYPLRSSDQPFVERKPLGGIARGTPSDRSTGPELSPPVRWYADPRETHGRPRTYAFRTRDLAVALQPTFNFSPGYIAFGRPQ